jgi:hypothetical protein
LPPFRWRGRRRARRGGASLSTPPCHQQCEVNYFEICRDRYLFVGTGDPVRVTRPSIPPTKYVGPFGSEYLSPWCARHGDQYPSRHTPSSVTAGNPAKRRRLSCPSMPPGDRESGQDVQMVGHACWSEFRSRLHNLIFDGTNDARAVSEDGK